MNKKSELIVCELQKLYPNAHCELLYNNVFELLCAVCLSAQTTDNSVNKVTPKLFEKYPNAFLLSKAEVSDVERIIKNIGLYRNKAKNLVLMSKMLVSEYGGNVPGSMEELVKLQGVGRKTANVVLGECFNIPTFAVDTHVSRVSKRLGIAKECDDVYDIETKLKKKFPRFLWNRLHHQIIFFGRYKCKAIKPFCDDCPFFIICKEKNKN